MLSTENPPPDLCEISQLRSCDGGSDERASDTNQQQLLRVDLFNSGLDYNNPLPNFSIRDYVFKTRGKDIKNNWPFSQKNLQLCLKHGVKDVLPPFQSLGSVRNPSLEEQRVVDSLRYCDVKYPELKDGGVRKRPAMNVENINSSECEEDKEFPSTTTSQSSSDINSVPPIINSCSEPEARYLPVSQAVQELKKAESNIQSPVKKCRLDVKNNIAEPKSNEDSAVVSETMASKVCPVCKSFSSSSNTTLNAHIDQCLSGESTIKWTANSKVIKHRIKPRKTRLMVDIYETALSCTLDDLDKRNGTNWASNMGLHPQDLEEASAEEEEEDEEEEKKKTYSPVDFEDINQEGAVYIDSSGTKLRILSKLNHPPLAKPNVNDSGACKHVKRDKGIKLLSSKKKKKKKHTVQRLEVQKNSLDGQGSCSPVPDQLPVSPLHGPESCYSGVEVSDDQQKVYPHECGKDDDPTKSPTASGYMKSDDFGMIKQWVGSKRTGLKKRTNHELENKHPDKSSKNLRIKSVSSLGDIGNSAPISPIASDENPMLPPEGLKRKENLCRSHDGWTELPFIRKGPGFSSLRSEHLTQKKNHLMSSKFNVKQSRKDSTSVHEHLVDPPNRAENHAPSRSNKRNGISSSPTARNYSSFIGSSISHHRTFSSEGKIATPPRKMSLGHAMPSGGKKFSSLRTKLLSVRHASGAEPKKNLGRDALSFKNPRLRCTLQSDDEAVVSQPTIHAEDILATAMEKNCGEPLTNRTRVLKLHERIGGSVNIGEGDMTSKGSETSSEPNSHIAGNEIDPFMGDRVLGEDAEMLDDFVCEPASTDAEAFVSFSKSLDSAFPGLSGSNVECVSQYYSKAYDETELVFHADQEMFCAHSVGKNLVTPGSHEMAEMDGDEAQGNYFVDVDPIPIPGPPGSFLPSPGRMGSEELLGHSSISTCRVQSSDDGHEVFDMDSSDSPISAISTVSNSIAGRSSSISTTNLSAQSHFQHETPHDVAKERNNRLVEGSPPFEQIAIEKKELNLLMSKDKLTLPEVTREVLNIQPCCCSRKDVLLQGGSLDYQESQILRRRTMTTLSVNDDVRNETHCIDLRAETLSEKEPTPLVTGKDLANSTIGYAPVPVPHNSEAMFRACGDCEFPSPSTSNPVLRLMGKNLMVVNKDANLSSQSSVMIEHPGVSLCVENGLSTRNNQNEPNSFHHMLSQGPSMFDNMQAHVPAHQLGFNSSYPFKIPTNYRPSQLSCHPSTAMCPNMSFGDDSHEYGRGFSLIRPDDQTTYDTETAGTQKADSCAGKYKEIIIIDDSPESEAVKATHCSTNKESMSLPAADSRHVNPFYSYQMPANHHHAFSGSPMVANRNNTMVPPSKEISGNLAKWNCILEGSSVRHSNSSAASLPSSAHLRSLYYSPGFS